MLKLSHKDLDVWKTSIELVKEIYSITSLYPKEELFGITNQLRKASVSIPSNISEGLYRKSKIEKSRFLEITRSSLVEIDTQIEISIDIKICKSENIKKLKELSSRVFAVLSKMISNFKKEI
ncbi:MAG: hypothetical protein CO128_05635 [Ignavibacteriales bacterium CG_4_9_14_3_um_filter_30_11]|nr:MAG: hypothetical protein CO128_05635 [Ignavibacteriales bacterium CG_4_9_14_3_um_filter_30_11]